MSEIKVKKLFFNLSIVSIAIAVVLNLIYSLPYQDVHSVSLIFKDIIPVASLILFAVFLFVFKEIKKEIAIIPLIVGQLSLAFSYTFYYTKLNIGPWKWHAMVNSNNIIYIIPHIVLVIFLFFVLFNVFKSKTAIIVSAVVAFSPEVLRCIIGIMNNAAGISDGKFDLITVIQFFILLAVVLAYIPIKFYLKSEESLEKYDLNSIANNLSKYTGKENLDPFGTSDVENKTDMQAQVNNEEKKQPEEINQVQAKNLGEENVEIDQTQDDVKEEIIEKENKPEPKFKQVVPFGVDLLNELKNDKKVDKPQSKEKPDKIKEEVKEEKTSKPQQLEPKEKSEGSNEEPNEQLLKEDINSQKAEPNPQYAGNPYANYNPYAMPPVPPYYMPMQYPPQQEQQPAENQDQQNQQYNPYYQQPMPPYPPYYYPQPQQQPDDPNQQQYAYPPQGAPMPYYPYPPYQEPTKPEQKQNEDE